MLSSLHPRVCLDLEWHLRINFPYIRLTQLERSFKVIYIFSPMYCIVFEVRFRIIINRVESISMYYSFKVK